ncbi:hypothetical protein [Klebsiella variicola]|uniref:hypothetical protein n=1 Tax=Klebsiella variicola TaxID=244366 RepID=UPI000AEAF6EB|nr:hypothetical protein [Klebsiella variicola]
MERQQDIEERSRDLIKNADEKERQELKCFESAIWCLFGSSFPCVSWIFFCAV